MGKNLLKDRISREIEELRSKIHEEFKNCKKLSSPRIVALSEQLDEKIAEYQINFANKH